MGEINKANKTIKNQKATATPTVTSSTPTATTETYSETTPMVTRTTAAPTQTTTTTTETSETKIPRLSHLWADKNKNNADAAASSLGTALGSRLKTYNTNDFIHTDYNTPDKNSRNLNVNFNSSVSKILDRLNQDGVPPENAQTTIRSIFENPGARKAILGEKSIFNEPQYLEYFAKQNIGGGRTYDSDAIQQIAGMYTNLKKEYDATHKIARGQKVTNTMQDESDIGNVIEQVKGKTNSDKIKVTKTK